MEKLLAQSLTLPGGQGAIQGPLASNTTIGGVVSAAVPFIFIFAGTGLFLMLIAGGFDFLTSAGDPKKLDQGRQRLTYAVVGFIIIFAAFWIVQAAGIIFGLPTFTTSFR